MTHKPGIFITLAFLLIGFQAMAQNTSLLENEYINYIQTLIGGEKEVTVASGRVDLVTEEYAIEVEKAPNWKEAIGQSLWYGLNTNKKPAIILIIEDQAQYKYFIQLNSALTYGNLSETITVFAFPNDFRELMNQ